MYKLILPILIFLLSGCNEQITTRFITQETPVKQQFEGQYHFEHGGFLELISNDLGELTFSRIDQELVTVNPYDNSLAYHKPVEAIKLLPVGDTIRFILNVSYTSSQKLKEDTGNKVIEGQHRTVYTIKLIDGDRIELTIDIYKGKSGEGLDKLLATRTIRSL